MSTCRKQDLIKDLAFRIIYDLSVEQSSTMDVTEHQAKTWEGFKYCTEAIGSYLLYINTGKLKFLENVRKNCIESLETEKEYPLLFKLFFSLGVEYSNNRYYSLSEEVLRRCVNIRPHEAKAYNTLSPVLANLNHNDEALDAANEAIEKLKTYLKKVWLIKIYVLAALGRNKEALESLRQCTNLRFKEKKAYDALSTLINLGYNKETLETAEKAMEELKIDLDKVWLNGSFTHINLNHSVEALKAADGAIEELKTDLAIAWLNKSLALANIGRKKEALDAADKAIELNSNYAEAWSNKSLALANIGQYDKALDATDTAVAIDPNFSLAWSNKSFCSCEIWS